MGLVTSVTTCPKYALYLTAKGTYGVVSRPDELLTYLECSGDSGLSLRLAAKSPIVAGPLSAGVDVKLSWTSEYEGGLYRDGTGASKESFTVLYELKQCKKRVPRTWFRDSPEPTREGLDQFVPRAHSCCTDGADELV